ncbi:hypothetical protein [Flavobacterium sp. LS1P3]|uniref:hypothetical protein n=1 Tax=Flavobacterium sp. LS1P3 TaxID=3401720 RepID=UPI003AAABBF2
MEDRYELGSDYWDNLDCGYEKSEPSNKSNEELEDEYQSIYHEKQIIGFRTEIREFTERIDYYGKIVSYYKRKLIIDTKIYTSMVEQVRNDTKELESYKAKIQVGGSDQSSAYLYKRYGDEILKRYSDSIESYTKQAELFISLTGESERKIDYFGKKLAEYKKELKISRDYLKNYNYENDLN